MRRRLRLSLAALFTVVLVGGLAGAALPTVHHNWNCREVSLTVLVKSKTSHTVCYPCQPDLPQATPELVDRIWQQEICAPAS
ncbi:MAG: hypothetical protein ACRDJ1_13190 [Actinomycetota bacterium]